MAYTDIHTMTFTARAAGDVRGRTEIGLLRKAAVRLPLIANADDQRERHVCRTIMDGETPVQWVTAVLYVLDQSSQLANPTDAQVNTAVDTAWQYLTAARS